MEDNRDVEMGIGGQGVGVGGERERERERETGKERKIRRTHPGRCKYDQRGHANIDNLYAKLSNLRRHINWTENQANEYDMTADKDSKCHQKYVRKCSQVLYKIISDRERDCGGRGVGILLMRNEAVWKA